MIKGVQHPVGGHAVVNKWTMDAIYGVKPGETWWAIELDERVNIEYLRWAASDLGWIVGHEYTCYSPLFARYFVKGYLVLGTVTLPGTPPLCTRASPLAPQTQLSSSGSSRSTRWQEVLVFEIRIISISC